MNIVALSDRGQYHIYNILSQNLHLTRFIRARSDKEAVQKYALLT
jgi:hypothetical protein